MEACVFQTDTKHWPATLILFLVTKASAHFGRLHCPNLFKDTLNDYQDIQFPPIIDY